MDFKERFVEVPPARSLRDEMAEHPFLRGLSPEVLPLLTDCAMRSHFKKGDQIFCEGDPANRLYLLKSGRVALESVKNGRVAMIQYIGGGDVLGWSWLFPPYTWHFD